MIDAITGPVDAVSLEVARKNEKKKEGGKKKREKKNEKKTTHSISHSSVQFLKGHQEEGTSTSRM